MRACEIHGVELLEGTAPIRYGLMKPSRRYIAAHSKEFPNSNLFLLGGCAVSFDSPTEAKVEYCHRCRQAEENWKENPLDRFEDPQKDALLRKLQASQGRLSKEFVNALERIFPLALERSVPEMKKAHEHEVYSEGWAG